jgi:predicted transcriptional regulator
MEACYQTLTTIYEIVKSDPAPQTYLCTPHELILRQTQDWDTIQKHLKALAAEQLVIIRQLDKMAICITETGITKAKSLKNNFVNKKFTLPAKREQDIRLKPLK